MSFYNLNEIKEIEVVPGFHGKFIHTKNVTVAFWSIKAGSKLPEHKHPNEQITNVLDGELELIIKGEKKRLKAGETAIVASNISHQGTAVTNCYIIDVFNPAREDYQFEDD